MAWGIDNDILGKYICFPFDRGWREELKVQDKNEYGQKTLPKNPCNYTKCKKSNE